MLIITLILLVAAIGLFIAYRNQYRACELALHGYELSEGLEDMMRRSLILKLGAKDAAKEYISGIYYEFSDDRKNEIFSSLATSVGWTEKVSFWDESDMKRLANDLAEAWKKQYKVK